MKERESGICRFPFSDSSFYFFRPANALHTAITAANSTPATGHMTQLSRQEWPGRLHARYTAAATHQYTVLTTPVIELVFFFVRV